MGEITHTPLISVIMPVYNRRSYVSESVDSILKQTMSDFEFIIIDDHSTDGTFDLLRTLTDPRIRLLRNVKNLGISETMNRGIEEARGEFIARMDSDDIAMPLRFQKQLEFLRANTEVLCCGTNYEVIGTARISDMYPDHNWIAMGLLDNSQIANPSAMFRASVFKKTNLRYVSSEEPAEDYKMWTLLVKKGKLANLPDVLFKYRLHTTQVSAAREVQIREANRVAVEYAGELCNDHPDVARFIHLPILNLTDLKSYITVENLVIAGLQKRGVKTNKTYFSTRRKRRLRKSILNNPELVWVRKVELIIMSGTFLGWRTYFTFLLQSFGLTKT